MANACPLPGHPAEWKLLEFPLYGLSIRAHHPSSDYLSVVVQHTVATYSVAQIQTDRQPGGYGLSLLCASNTADSFCVVTSGACSRAVFLVIFFCKAGLLFAP